MANNFLILGTLAAFGWLFTNGPPPSTKPIARPLAQPVEATGPSMPSSVTASRSRALEARRDPVPFVRTVRPFPAPIASVKTQTASVEQQAPDGLDKRAAVAAVELDGYKRATILGKATNGAWRAKGYRGTTEVLLTVDGTGRVSMD